MSLGSASIGIVPGDLRLVRAACEILAGSAGLERQPGGIQPCISIPVVWLDMSALGPFIPGVDENQPLVGIRMPAGLKHCALQPPAVKLRVGVSINGAAFLPS